MKQLAFLALVATSLATATVAEAQARAQRSPRNQARLACRQQYRTCLRANPARGPICFKQRRACYDHARRTLPPTRPAPAGAPRR